MKNRAKEYEEAEDDTEMDRELTEYEQTLLAKFEENDAEIDQMLDNVMKGLDKLHLHA
jgi:hypothetical protein